MDCHGTIRERIGLSWPVLEDVAVLEDEMGRDGRRMSATTQCTEDAKRKGWLVGGAGRVVMIGIRGMPIPWGRSGTALYITLRSVSSPVRSGLEAHRPGGVP